MTFHDKLKYIVASLILCWSLNAMANPTYDTLYICNGQSIVIQGTTINSAGQYIITFQPGDSVVIYTVYLSQPYVSLGDDITVCERTVGMLAPQGTPGYYTWNNGMVADSIFIGISGIYSVTVTDEHGCTASDAINVTIQPNPNPVIENIPEPVCYGSNDIVLNGLPAGGIFSGDLLDGNIFLASQAALGFYNVYYTYTDSVGCSATVNAYIHVALCTGIDAIYSSGKPIINNRQLFTGSNSGDYIITDMTGRMVLYGCNDGSMVSLKSLPSGIYLLYSSFTKDSIKFVLD